MVFRVILLLFISITNLAQVITPIQQKALNNYIKYANHSAGEVTLVVESIINYFPSLQRDNANFRTRYTCPVQLEDYYLNQALKESKALGTFMMPLNAKLNDLRKEAEKIDEKCKTLDTYYKLEDYKQDNFLKAHVMIKDLLAGIASYSIKQAVLDQELELTYKKLNKYKSTDLNHKTDWRMRQSIAGERAFIGTWTFNLNQDVHTGWPVDKLEQSILETDNAIKFFNSFKPLLKYPASASYDSFRGSLASLLEIKRHGLDEYNFEAKKSDHHSNSVYLNLINYFNGTLIEDYNNFVNSVPDYLGLNAIKYVPALEIRDQAQIVEISIIPYRDISKSTLTVLPQKTAIKKSIFNALNDYIDFINESLRQINNLQQVVSNLNSSALYYKDLSSYKGKGSLTYKYENYVLPLSLLQKITAQSGGITPGHAKVLNDQTQVLLNILKELDQLNASLEIETSQKRYEKDNLKNLYEIIERCKTLFETFDIKKEQLYDDVRAIYESYPALDPQNSWAVSGKALQQLVDLDHEELFKAKAYYKGNIDITISTHKIDEALRATISNEYTNLKGIEKIGRNNGNCPYTPYEDLPESSKRLSQKLSELKRATQSGYNHPYHEMVYLYNEIVDDYNKFSNLSKEVFILKTIHQPELFFLENAARPNMTQENEVPKEKSIHTGSTQKNPIESATETAKSDQSKLVDKNAVVHDTVFVEKRDTVYMQGPGETLHSMEGYATNNMILLLDVSGSMNSPDKLPLLKQSVLDLFTMMRPEDEVSIVIYSGKAKVLLEPTSFTDKDRIKRVIEKLKSEGKTDGNAGLKMAYKVADDNYIRGGNNRIILATDGEFSILDETFQLVDKFSKQDIFISVFNFGKRANSAKNLQRLASIGKGNYEYITQENVEFKLIQEAKAKRKK